MVSRKYVDEELDFNCSVNHCGAKFSLEVMESSQHVHAYRIVVM